MKKNITRMALLILSIVTTASASAETKTLWENAAGYTVSWSSEPSDISNLLNDDVISSFSAGDELWVTVASKSADSQWPQIAFKCYTDDWKWADVPGSNVGLWEVTTFPYVAKITLTQEAINTLHHRFWPSGEAATITKIEHVTHDKGEFVANVAWEGSQDLGNWAAHVGVGAGKFGTLKAGDVILISLTCNSGYNYHQLKTMYEDSGWQVTTSNANQQNDYGCIQFDNYIKAYGMTVNDADAAKIKAGGFYLQGYGATVTKVEIIDGSNQAELKRTEGSHVLSAELDKYPDDYPVRINVNNTSGASRVGWGIGGISYMDNYSPIEKIPVVTGDNFDAYFTIGDLKRVAKNGTDSYVVSEYNRSGITFNIYNDCALNALYVFMPPVSEEPDQPSEAYLSTTDFAALTADDAAGIPDDVKTAITGLTVTDGKTATQVTISESGSEEAPNKYNVSEEGTVQLEMNGGTLTFQAKEGASLRNVTFYYSEWNEANSTATEAVIAARADDGADEELPSTGFTVDADKRTAQWNGYADKLTVTIAGKTLIDKITIVIGEKAGEATIIDVATGKDLATEVAAAFDKKPYLGSITLNLAKNGQYTVSQPLYTSKPLVINGAEGAVIDAKDNSGAFIQMMTLPELSLNEDGAYPIDEVTIRNVEIKNLKNRLFYADRQKYLIHKLTLENSIVGIDGTISRTVFDFYCGGNTEELIIRNSTLWAPSTAVHNNTLFSSQGGQDVPTLGGEASKFIIQNSTFYNIANGSKVMQHRDHSRSWLSFELKDNVIVNSGEKGAFVLGMNEGQPGEQCTWNISHNAFNADGADTSAQEKYVQNSVAGIVHFKDADKGDFTLADSDAALAALIGDPRWLGTSAPTAIDTVKSTPATDGAWYTLQGVRVSQPAKGLYIHNGKKVVIK